MLFLHPYDPTHDILEHPCEYYLYDQSHNISASSYSHNLSTDTFILFAGISVDIIHDFFDIAMWWYVTSYMMCYKIKYESDAAIKRKYIRQWRESPMIFNGLWFLSNWSKKKPWKIITNNLTLVLDLGHTPFGYFTS